MKNASDGIGRDKPLKGLNNKHSSNELLIKLLRGFIFPFIPSTMPTRFVEQSENLQTFKRKLKDSLMDTFK